MARQTNHPYIVAIIFATKLRANSQIARDLQNFRFPFKIAPRMAKRIAPNWQAIQCFD